MISYAQNFEDVMLARALGDRTTGFYVDVGACYPDIASVTRHFYEAGWRGVNVEPMGEPFALLRAARPRDVNVNAAIASYSGEIPIFQGASMGESSALRPYETARAIMVPCLTLEELCKRHVDRPIDFLKIDVEGLEQDVVMGGDWQRYRPVVLVIEVARPWTNERRPDAVEIGDFLRGKGYDEVFFDGLNAFFLAREAGSLAPRFSCPANVLDRFTMAREAALETETTRIREYAENVGQRLTELEKSATDEAAHAQQMTARAVAAERELAEAGSRAASAEARARLAELLGEERLAARQEKDLAVAEAQRLWRSAMASLEQSQARSAKVASRLEAARFRADEIGRALAETALWARSVSQEAEARARSAALDAQLVAERARIAEARAEQADAQASSAETRAQTWEARAHERDAHASSADTKARALEARMHDAEVLAKHVEAIAHALEVRAQRAESRLAWMERTRSWRVTAPLRSVTAMLRRYRPRPLPLDPPTPAPDTAERTADLHRMRVPTEVPQPVLTAASGVSTVWGGDSGEVVVLAIAALETPGTTPAASGSGDLASESRDAAAASPGIDAAAPAASLEATAGAADDASARPAPNAGPHVPGGEATDRGSAAAARSERTGSHIATVEELTMRIRHEVARRLGR